MALASQVIETSPEPVLRELFGDLFDDRLPALQDEYRVLEKELTSRQATYSPAYPAEYRIGLGGAFLLYSIIRLKAPLTVLETGVADGYSTFFLLHALERNGLGRLISCDISAHCAGILTDEERRAWSLQIIDTVSPKESLRSILDALVAIDVFIHDSDHSYRWQMLELEAAAARLAPAGLVVCDDADASYALLDFAHRIGVRPLTLVENRKAVGLLPSVTR